MACLSVAALLGGVGETAAVGTTAGLLGEAAGVSALGGATMGADLLGLSQMGGAVAAGGGAEAGLAASTLGGLGQVGADGLATGMSGWGAGGINGASGLTGFGGAPFVENPGGLSGAMGDSATQYLGQMGANSPLTVGSSGFGNLGMADVKSALQWASPLSSIMSGITGIQQSGQIKKAGQQAALAANPWGTNGGQALAGSQLQQLMTNPGQVAATDRAYALRVQGAQRAAAQQGQDSGAMSVAGANASTDWYNQRMQSLSGLAGAGVNPGTGAQLGLTGQVESANMLSKGLGSMAYGTNSIPGVSGATATMPPAVQQWFKQQGYLGG